MKHECTKCGNPFEIEDKQASEIVEAMTTKSTGPLCPTCFRLWETRVQPEPQEVFVPIRDSKYKYTDDMGEISGFGGGYEQTCRNMVIAGIESFESSPEADANTPF